MLGGLAVYAAASGAPVWGAAAIALSGLSVLALGAWVAASVRGAVRALAAEVGRVAGAVVAGKLDARAELDQLSPYFRAVAEQVNGLLEPLARSVGMTTDALSKLARGEVPSPAKTPQVRDLAGAGDAVNGAARAVGRLLEDVKALSSGALKEQLEVKLDLAHAGRFQEAVASIQAANLHLLERCNWFEQILDAIPFPLSVTDRDMRWTFINAPVEKLLGVKRKDLAGKACENWNADICRTENCGIARLRKGELSTRFNQQGMNFRVDTAYLKNLKGESVGHVEVVQDITALTRVGEYQREELGRFQVPWFSWPKATSPSRQRWATATPTPARRVSSSWGRWGASRGCGGPSRRWCATRRSSWTQR